MKPHERFLRQQVNDYGLSRWEKQFLDVEVKTFLDSRDSNNHFHNMLCISNSIYKVSENFPTHSCDHTTNILRYIPENELLFEFSCQKEFPQFSNYSFMATNFEECDLEGILRSSCFYFIFLSMSPNFVIMILKVTWQIFTTTSQ